MYDACVYIHIHMNNERANIVHVYVNKPGLSMFGPQLDATASHGWHPSSSHSNYSETLKSLGGGPNSSSNDSNCDNNSNNRGNRNSSSNSNIIGSNINTTKAATQASVKGTSYASQYYKY